MATWIVVYALILLVIIYFSFKDIKNLFFGYVFMVPFFGLMVNLGVNLTVDRFVAILMGLVLLFNFKKISRKTIPAFVVIFLIYAIVLTAVMSIFIPMSVSSSTIFNGQWRFVPQLLMFLLNFVPLIFALTYLNKPEDIKKTVKVFLIAVTILALLALLQTIIWYLSHNNIFPITILDPNNTEKISLITISGQNVLRISSLGGEPKNFAYSLVFGLCLLFVRLIYNRRQWFDLPLIILFSFLLVLTFSTQGYIILAIGILVISFVYVFLEGLNKSRKIFFLLILLILLAILLFYFYPNLWEILKSRTFDRLWQPYVGIAEVDDFNAAVLAFLAASPIYWLIGVGWGNTQYYARDFLLDKTRAWAPMNSSFSAQSGALRIVSELGVPGLLLFFIMYLKPVFYLWKAKFKTILEKEVIIYAFFALAAFSLAQDGPNYIYIVLAMAYLLYNFRRYPQEIEKEKLFLT